MQGAGKMEAEKRPREPGRDSASCVPRIKTWGFAEAVCLEDQKEAVGPLALLIKDREGFGKSFPSGDVSPNYNWAMGQHKIKLLEPVRPD